METGLLFWWRDLPVIEFHFPLLTFIADYHVNIHFRSVGQPEKTLGIVV